MNGGGIDIRMSARFIVRLDDVCTMMNWTVWEEVEAILMRHGVKPIIAVVPDNRDPKLIVDSPRSNFWDCVREWQGRGWTVALHGHQHSYSTKDAGIIGLNPYSEFAVLSYQDQKAKLEKAFGILEQEKVKAEAWIAPAHAFDVV